MFENIPAELRALPQWVAAGINKIPINPRTGQPADPTNPNTGGTFAEAIQAGMKHVGFILGANDPFTVIDLDDPWQRKDKTIIVKGDSDWDEAAIRAERHTTIFQTFDTYAELSQSGSGIHLVMLGEIPAGVRRDKVEIYSKDRYIIFTGNVLRASAVNDCQTLLNGMFRQMSKMLDEAGDLIEEDQICSDEILWARAANADNGDKFVALCEATADSLPGAKDGTWTELGYESQSEADYALLSMLAFYTRCNEQVRRMFRETGLGQRRKANRNDDYLNRSLKRMRAREVPFVDISALQLIPAKQPPVIENTETVVISEDGYSFPPGLMGRVADYILSSAIRPVKEVALAAAIALCAGVAGRSYNISGTGLNQYIILLAKTGRGKEGAATGIDNLIAAVRQIVPMADQFMGPAAFASGQALVKCISKQPCFLSLLGEFGLTLQQICDPQAPGPLVMLRRVLLDIYVKSGFHKMLRASVYSDSDKNIPSIQAPNVTVLGESTPETFFSGLDASHILEGLIPRFTVIEYHGPRPAPNPNAFHAPPDELVQEFAKLISVAVNTAQNHTCCPISISPDAKRHFDMLNIEADKRINDTGLDTEAELWNRAHLKAMKLAGLVAVGCEPHAPCVSGAVALWACTLIRREIMAMMRRFSSGDLGGGEDKQEAEVRRLFEHFQLMSPEQRATHRCPDGMMDAQIVPFTFLAVYTRRLACFRNDKRGAGAALRYTLDDMVKREVLEMIPLHQLKTQFNMRSPIYYPGPAW